MIFQFLFGQFGTVLHLVQKNGDLIGLQTDNLLVVELWHGDQRGRVGCNGFMLVEIVVKTPQRRELSHLAPL